MWSTFDSFLILITKTGNPFKERTGPLNRVFNHTRCLMLTFLPVALRSEQRAVSEADVCRLPAPVSGRAVERICLRANALCGCRCLIPRTEFHDFVKDYGFNIVLSYAKSDSRLPPVFAWATSRATLLLRVFMVLLGGFPFAKHTRILRKYVKMKNYEVPE